MISTVTLVLHMRFYESLVFHVKEDLREEEFRLIV